MARADKILEWVIGPDVLDIGCSGHEVMPSSEDWLHGRLREKFPRLHGIDVSVENIALMRSMGYAGIEVADAQSFSLKKRFDTIVAGELIEHLENPGSFLEAAKRHLKRRGRIVITTPYPFSLVYFIYALMKFPKTCTNPQHTQWFCPSTMTELAKRASLKVAHWEMLAADYAGLRSGRFWLLTQALRRIEWMIPKRIRYPTMLFVLAEDDAAEQRLDELGTSTENRQHQPG